MIQLVKPAMFIGIILVVLLGGSALFETGNNWIKNQIDGPEYCFREMDVVSYSIEFNDFGVSNTEKKGDELCFRTKDFSKVEKISQQIQDRKYEIEFEKIKSQERFYNEGLPKILLILGAVVIVVLIIIYLSSGRDYRGF